VKVGKARAGGFSTVESAPFSPIAVQRANGITIPSRIVVPALHTPYDFYERIYLDA
jgi:hypothetical protein